MWNNRFVILLIFYLWIMIASPQNRFLILDVIHFERLFVIVFCLFLLGSGRIKLNVSSITFSFVLFYLWLFISLFNSPYFFEDAPQEWLLNYWKLIVFYFILLFSVNSYKELCTLFSGFAIISIFYQLHSWTDYLGGGCYVYQQGLKRMIGVWSSGLGAANSFGILALYSIPFAYFWYSTTQHRMIRLFLFSSIVVSVFSIVFSGTRGAFVSLGIYVLFNILTSRKRIRVTFILILFGIFLFQYIPSSLKYRFFGLTSDDYVISDRMAEIQSQSSQSRLQGLADGFELALRRPILGYGPNASSLARLELANGLDLDTDSVLGLHNLYGQVISESGFVGTIIFTITLALCVWNSVSISNMKPELIPLAKLLQGSLFVMLVYGMAGHTLYRFYWVFLIASFEAFRSVVFQREDSCER